MSFCMIFLFLFFTWELKVRCLKHKWVFSVCNIVVKRFRKEKKKCSTAPVRLSLK